MRRRAALCVVAIILMLMVAAGTALTLLLHHVPAFYARTALPEGLERRNYSREFQHLAIEFWNDLGGDRSTGHQFAEQQFNGYFQEQEGDADPPFRFVEIPEDIHDMRVAFEHDRVRVGFRYGRGWWSSVVTVDFRMWLVARKPNVIALELCGFRAGALPLGTQVLLDYVTEAARQANIEVTWFRNQGHPIALLQIQANQPRPTFLIRRLEVQSGQLVIVCGPTHETAQPASTAARGLPNP